MAHRAAANLPNLLAPVVLDVHMPVWPVKRADAAVCINMIHISPWAATEGLMRGAAALLAPGAPLYLYGPYVRQGVQTAPSNLEFDADLKRRNPAWGLRDLADVAALAQAAVWRAGEAVCRRKERPPCLAEPGNSGLVLKGTAAGRPLCWPA